MGEKEEEEDIVVSVPPPRIKAVDATRATSDPVIVKGWVRTIRKQKTLAFVEVNDGSNLQGIQCVLSFDEIDDDTKSELDKVTTGCSVSLEGKLVESPNKKKGGKQSIELSSYKLSVIGTCPGDEYPLAKKRHSLEYLRTIAHLRPRTNTIAAIARVRSSLAGYVHEFFQKQNFVYVQTPLITASDCEGAGEMFRVTTLDLDKGVDKLPTKKIKKKTKKKTNEEGEEEEMTMTEYTNEIDYEQDFFNK